MPVLPENRGRYPKDWPESRERILERAKNCCEGTDTYPVCNAVEGEPHPETGSTVRLSVAHLDHFPENCNEYNLRALCQRCHLAWDKEHHANTRRERRN